MALLKETTIEAAVDAAAIATLDLNCHPKGLQW
jgi:hypothetical protein